MIRAGLVLLYFVAVVTAPWYVFLLLAILLIVYARLGVVALVGAALYDTLYGVPIPSLGSYEFLYTTVVGVLFLASLVLRRRLLE